MRRKTIFTLAKKEFFGFVNSPLAYTILVPFLVISTFIYLRMVLVVGEASMRAYFEILPWFLLLLAPSLSMKLLTDEYKSNTIELLFAHPITELEIVFGKFVGALTFFIVILFTTIGLPFTILSFSKADFGIILAQYVGAIFIGGTFLSIGLAASAYVKNAISSFLLAASASFILLIIGLDFVTLFVPPPFNRVVSELAIFSHLGNITRGLLDIRDISYFVSLTLFFLLTAVTKLSERKIVEDKKEKRKLTFAYALVIGIGILSNALLFFYPLRIDLTASRLFTLSEGTKQTVRNLKDIVIINIFSSRNLPSEMKLKEREVNDLLRDYQKLNKKIIVQNIYPDENMEAANQARSLGVEEVTFNRIGAGKFEVQTGFLGIAIRFADKTEVIPFVQDTSDLEYQITRRIRKLTSDKEQTVGIYKNSFERFNIFEEIIGSLYKISQVDLGNPQSLKDTKALIVIDDGVQTSTASAILADYLKKNGKVLFLANGVAVNSQQLLVNKAQQNYPILSDYGVKINNDLVYDLELNETLAFGQGNVRYFAPYPYWIRALPESSDFAPLSTIKSVSLAWPSSLTISEKEGISIKKLLTTSLFSGKVESNFNISPNAISSLTPTTKEKIPLAALVEKGESRLVVIGNTFIISDQFLRNSPENASFLSNTVDWLAAEKDLALIPSRSARSAVFEFRSPVDLLLVQYGNLILPPLAVIGFAIFYLRRRRILERRVFIK